MTAAQTLPELSPLILTVLSPACPLHAARGPALRAPLLAAGLPDPDERFLHALFRTGYRAGDLGLGYAREYGRNLRVLATLRTLVHGALFNKAGNATHDFHCARRISVRAAARAALGMGASTPWQGLSGMEMRPFLQR